MILFLSWAKLYICMDLLPLGRGLNISHDLKQLLSWKVIIPLILGTISEPANTNNFRFIGPIVFGFCRCLYCLWKMTAWIKYLALFPQENHDSIVDDDAIHHFQRQDFRCTWLILPALLDSYPCKLSSVYISYRHFPNVSDGKILFFLYDYFPKKWRIESTFSLLDWRRQKGNWWICS